MTGVSSQNALEAVFADGNRSTDIAKLTAGKGYAPNWFLCADSTVLSVLAGGGTYCLPRGDDGPFTHVEVWWPGDNEPTGYVEIDRVRAFVESHGGVTAVARDEQDARRTGGAA